MKGRADSLGEISVCRPWNMVANLTVLGGKREGR